MNIHSQNMLFFLLRLGLIPDAEEDLSEVIIEPNIPWVEILTAFYLTTELFKEGKISAEEFASKLSRNAKTSQQVVKANNIESVEKVVSTIHESFDSAPLNIVKETCAFPPIIRYGVKSKAKLLVTDVESPTLHGFRKFLAFTDRMTQEYYSFFIQPHTTKVIWSMHRIIYIFALNSGDFTIYYNLELKKHLDNALTGGDVLQTTTIITENKIFVPIPQELEDYFSIKDGVALTFTVNYDSIDGE